MSASALLPLFRSEQQLRIVGELFAEHGTEYTIGELAERARASQPTVSREVARLLESGLVRSRTVGRNRFVAANWDLPWSDELRSILLKTVGVLGRLSEALSHVPDIEAAYIFGSWAARHAGEVGPPPRDVDVLVVGSPAQAELQAACRAVERQIDRDVNPVTLDPETWDDQHDPFVAEVRTGPLVPIPLPARH